MNDEFIKQLKELPFVPFVTQTIIKDLEFQKRLTAVSRPVTVEDIVETEASKIKGLF